MKIEKVITSVTADLNYSSFLTISVLAWNQLYGIAPTVIFIRSGDSTLDSSYERWMGLFSSAVNVEIITVDRIPQINYGVQARATRMFMASEFDTTNMVVDVDMIMLNKDFLGFADNIPNDHFVQFGYDHPSFQKSPDIGKWPMDKTVARGDVWKEIVNPKGLPYKDWILSQTGFPEDHRTNIFKPFEVFCDESLLKCMLDRWGNKRVAKVRRDEVPCECPRDGRLYGRLYSQEFPTLDGVDLSKYYEVHGPRPRHHNEDWYTPVVSYIESLT